MASREKTSAENPSIGSLALDSPLILAPLAGYTIPPFRDLCRRLGASLGMTEMISAAGLKFSSKKTGHLLEIVPGEQPLGIQLFGSDPQVMAEGARWIADRGFALVDINMGCPVPKVVKNGAGSALLNDPDRAVRIVESVVAATDLPVTVKVRLGWEEMTVHSLLPRLVDAGAQAISVHGRTRAQGYRGKADWESIGLCKEVLKGQIPLFGSGDLFSADRILEVLNQGLCDGVHLARGAMNNPWLFRETRSRLRGEEVVPPTREELKEGCLGIFEWLSQRFGEKRGVLAFRGFFCQLVKGMSGAAASRKSIFTAETAERVHEILSSVFGH